MKSHLEWEGDPPLLINGWLHLGWPFFFILLLKILKVYTESYARYFERREYSLRVF